MSLSKNPKISHYFGARSPKHLTYHDIPPEKDDKYRAGHTTCERTQEADSARLGPSTGMHEPLTGI